LIGVDSDNSNGHRRMNAAVPQLRSRRAPSARTIARAHPWWRQW
jgi:hypothetical protein